MHKKANSSGALIFIASLLTPSLTSHHGLVHFRYTSRGTDLLNQFTPKMIY